MLFDYTKTNQYYWLTEKHSVEEYGTWSVTGEDLNADYNGSHSQPVLGYYTGKLQDVINTVTKLPRFYTWGGGGEITKIEIQKV